MNKCDQLIGDQHLHTCHFVNENTQQKYNGYNEGYSIENLFQGFDSLCIFYGIETEPICFNVKWNSVCTTKKGRRVNAHCKTCRLSINLSWIISLNSNQFLIIGGAGNIKWWSTIELTNTRHIWLHIIKRRLQSESEDNPIGDSQFDNTLKSKS